MKNFSVIVLLVFLAGCSTAGQRVRPISEGESREDVESAMGAVVGSVSGQSVDREELHKLGQQIRDDKEAQSAVQSISNAVEQGTAAGKYCPVDGERYGAKFTTCPKHGALLKNIEE